MNCIINNLQVEALKWTGFNVREVQEFVKGHKVERFTTGNYVSFIYIDDIKFRDGDHIIKTKSSLFRLSYSDFLETCEPINSKFNIGDKVYSEDWSDGELSITWFIVNKILGGGFYEFEDRYGKLHESVLFTKEELIEKIEEL